MSWLPRLCLLALAAAALATPRTALADAQAESLDGGGRLDFEDKLLIHDESRGSDTGNPDDLVVPANERAGRLYFNAAHCTCGAANAGDETKVGFEVRLTGPNVPGNPAIEVFSGNECNVDTSRQNNCKPVPSEGGGEINALATSLGTIKVPVERILNPQDAETCPTITGKQQLFLMVNDQRGAAYDYYTTVDFNVDTKAPPEPRKPTASGSEGAVQLSWDYEESDDIPDIEYFQALCAAGQEPVMGVDKKAARYVSSLDLCGEESGVTLKAVDPGGDGAPVSEPPAGFAGLDDAFICGEATATARSMRIGGLKNGTPYTVALLAIDFYGNATGVYFNKTVTPQQVDDFWEIIQDDSEVEGGYCLLVETYGDGGLSQALRNFRDGTLASTAYGRWLIAVYYGELGPVAEAVAGSAVLRVIAAIVLLPAVALALLWHVLTLPGLLLLVATVWVIRRRRGTSRRWRLTPAMAAAALVLAPGIASAQSIAPYWEEEEAELVKEEEPRWIVGVKVGPYTPEIDKQYRDQGGSGSPFKNVFVGGMWLPQLDVDYLVWRGSGQLGIGGSAGFTGDGAKAFLPGTMTRSKGDETSFRMVPLAATVTYRATQLDDLYGIPLIPYARGGLAYYVWWVLAPSGKVAKVLEGPEGVDCVTQANMCSENRAAGGTLGLVGSVGLAIRAEGIDRSAALSMREGGIHHAGFYVEGSLGWVDGFGNDKKLALGDLTWFGGFNFEF